MFHNGSTYDYHFIIEQLAEDFKGPFECLGEKTEKYITFSAPIKKDDNSKKITYKLKFIDSYRFMQSKLSDLVDNLSGIYDNKYKKCMETKQIKIEFKSNRLNYISKKCKNKWTRLINETIKTFPHIYQFCNGDHHKFILL